MTQENYVHLGNTYDIQIHLPTKNSSSMTEANTKQTDARKYSITQYKMKLAFPQEDSIGTVDA